MKNLDFLNKLRKEGKFEIIESSEQMSLSYEKKGVECREVANLAFVNGYFESAITQSYYSMYNNVLSLFFKCGIKCENHSAAVILLKEFFSMENGDARKEQIAFAQSYFAIQTGSFPSSTSLA